MPRLRPPLERAGQRVAGTDETEYRRKWGHENRGASGAGSRVGPRDPPVSNKVEDENGILNAHTCSVIYFVHNARRRYKLDWLCSLQKESCGIIFVLRPMEREKELRTPSHIEAAPGPDLEV